MIHGQRYNKKTREKAKREKDVVCSEVVKFRER